MKIISIHPIDTSKKTPLSFFDSTISAGFPSPADDFADKKIDLNEELIQTPSATFFVKVQGDSMRDAGILNQDMLVVDRSIQPKSGRVIVAVIDGEFTVKRLKKQGSAFWLYPENKKYSPIKISQEMEFIAWGVVTYAIHSL